MLPYGFLQTFLVLLALPHSLPPLPILPSIPLPTETSLTLTLIPLSYHRCSNVLPTSRWHNIYKKS